MGHETGIIPDPRAAAESARRCAVEAGDIKLANAYGMLADTLTELADARERIHQLESEKAQ